MSEQFSKALDESLKMITEVINTPTAEEPKVKPEDFFGVLWAGLKALNDQFDAIEAKIDALDKRLSPKKPF